MFNFSSLPDIEKNKRNKLIKILNRIKNYIRTFLNHHDISKNDHPVTYVSYI